MLGSRRSAAQPISEWRLRIGVPATGWSSRPVLLSRRWPRGRPIFAFSVFARGPLARPTRLPSLTKRHLEEYLVVVCWSTMKPSLVIRQWQQTLYTFTCHYNGLLLL